MTTRPLAGRLCRAAGLLAATCVGSLALAQNQFTITYDAEGIPYVQGVDAESTYMGVGYATARDRLFHMWRLRLSGQGRMAEFFGPDAHPTPKQLDAYDRAIRLGKSPTKGWIGQWYEQDYKRRVIGLAHHAEVRAQRLQTSHPAEYGYLQAYADGVNTYIKDALAAQFANPGGVGVDDSFDPAFATWGIEPWAGILVSGNINDWDTNADRWTVADSILVWMTVSQPFLSDPYRDVLGAGLVRKYHTGGGAMPSSQWPEAFFGRTVSNDATATVQYDEIPTAVRSSMTAYESLRGIDHVMNRFRGPFVPHFSEAAAVFGSLVSGDEDGAAKAYLWQAPRIKCGAPSPIYEFYMECTDANEPFRVRGAAPPGSPNMLSGSTFNDPEVVQDFVPVAWSVCSGSRDLSDVWELDAQRTTGGLTYTVDGATKTATRRTETLKIKLPGGMQLRSIDIDTTDFGVVIPPGEVKSMYAAAQRITVAQLEAMITAGTVVLPELAVSASYMTDLSYTIGQDCDTPFVAFAGMYQASGVHEFLDAVRQSYSYPSTNMTIVDSGPDGPSGDGNIAYTTTSAIPVRMAVQSPTDIARWAPLLPMDGSTAASHWQEYVLEDNRPYGLNPSRGYFVNANGAGFASNYIDPVSGNTEIVPLSCYYGGIGEIDDRGFELRRIFKEALASPSGQISHSQLIGLSQTRTRRSAAMFCDILAGCQSLPAYQSSATASKTLAYLQQWNGGHLTAAEEACFAGVLNYGAVGFEYVEAMNLNNSTAARIAALDWARDAAPGVLPTNPGATGYGDRNYGVMNFIETTYERINTAGATPLQPEEMEVATWIAEVWHAKWDELLDDPATAGMAEKDVYYDRFIWRKAPEALMPRNWDRLVGGMIPPSPGAGERDPIGLEMFLVDPISLVTTTLADCDAAVYNGVVAITTTDEGRRYTNLALGPCEKTHGGGLADPMISTLWNHTTGRLRAAPMTLPGASAQSARNVSYP